jgi:hypothetical protein
MPKIALLVNDIVQRKRRYDEYLKGQFLELNMSSQLKFTQSYQRVLADELNKLKALCTGTVTEVEVTTESQGTKILYYANMDNVDIEDLLKHIESKRLGVKTWKVKQVIPLGVLL